MCGIAGFVNFKPSAVDPLRIKRMCTALAHRGPDDAGYLFLRPHAQRDTYQEIELTDKDFTHKNGHDVLTRSSFRDFQDPRHWQAVLGHRRLSILDLSADGHQPMSSCNGRTWIVFNGEIYNYPVLRSELEAKGVEFRSQSDTEVLLELWNREGPDCLNKLNGMFAFAAIDLHKKTITLARDRFGIKPLYYFQDIRTMAFGSEIKALLASGAIEPHIDPATLCEYFAFQNTLTEQTLFRGIKSLPAGHYLQMSLSGGEPQPVSYWQPEFQSNQSSFEETCSELVTSFAESVQSQLVSDVPVGSFLSGGMDSGSIVAIASKLIPHMSTFTIGFDMTHVDGLEQGFDERSIAESLSHLMQTSHYEAVLHSGDMPKAMEQLTRHMDDLRVGMCHPNWYASKLASKFVKVCLAGTGGDELFGGYPWRYQFSLADSVEEFDDIYSDYWFRLMPAGELSNLFNGDLGQFFPEVHRRFKTTLNANNYDPGLDLQSNLLNRAFAFEMKTFLHGLLIVEDHMSMAHSMETRVPFLDNRLVDLSLSMNPQFKVKFEQGFGQLTEGKFILRKAMENFLPGEYVHQRKQGFSPPDGSWYRGPSVDYIKQILLDPVSKSRPYFNHGFMEKKLSEHFEGRNNNRLLIWSLLCFEWLQRHYIDTHVHKGTEAADISISS